MGSPERIALRKEIFETTKKEALYIGLLFLLILVTFKIIFYKEELIVIARFVLSFYFALVLPGFSLLLYWVEKLGFFERFVISIPLSAALVGILSYYIGILGVHIKYLSLILPIFLILLGFGIFLFLVPESKISSEGKQ